MLMGGAVASKQKFTDFTPDWYSLSGNVICLYVLISSIFSNVIDVANCVKVFYKRAKDRKFKLQLKYDLDDEDDD